MADFLARRSRLALIAVSGLILVGTTAEAQRSLGELVVVPIGDEMPDVEMTRAGLEDATRRFADRFYTAVTQSTNQIRNREDQTSRIRLFMHQWKTVSAQTIIELAIGAEPVTTLLDMMVLTRLSRLMIDGYWTEQLLAEEGALMSSTYATLEQDIWSVGARVLSAEQIDTLRDLIDDWYRDNSDQTYPWYIRLDEFSDQRAVALQELSRGGGLLGIREARESIEEFQAFGERLLFYVQRAPTLMSYELEASVYEILAAEEVASLVGDADQFAASVEEMVDVIAGIPQERIEAIDQLMEQLGAEREELMADLRATSPEAEGALEEVRLALEAFERILVTLDVDPAARAERDSRPFDITEYQALAVEAGQVVAQLNELLGSVESLLASPVWENGTTQAEALIDRLAEVEERLINRLYLFGVLLILSFFVCLTVYRLLMAKVFRIGRT